MKRLLLLTFLVGSSLLFSDLYASNNFNEGDTANNSLKKTNTFKSIVQKNETMKIFATFTDGGYTLADENPFSYNFQDYTKALGLNSGEGIDPEKMAGKVETKENTLLCEKEEEKKAAADFLFELEENLRKERAIEVANKQMRRVIKCLSFLQILKQVQDEIVEGVQNDDCGDLG